MRAQSLEVFEGKWWLPTFPEETFMTLQETRV